MSKKCPYCDEMIADTAKKCRWCGEWLEPAATVNNQPEYRQAHPVPTGEPQPFPGPTSVDVNDDDDEEEKEKDDNYIEESFFKAYYIIPFIKQYCDFSGYTTRHDFWMSVVMNMIVSLGIYGVTMLLVGSGLMWAGVGVAVLYALFTFLPGIALCVRRLRDIKKSPFLILLSLVPVIGCIILLILYCLPSKFDDHNDDDVEYYDMSAKWSGIDWGVTVGSAVLLVAGVVMIIITTLSSFDHNDMSGQYAAFEDDTDDDYPVLVDSAEIPQSSDEGISGTYTGYIGNNEIEIVLNDDNNNLSGRMRYVKMGNAGWLEIRGNITFPDYADGGLVTMYEINDEGMQTGLFEGQLTIEDISGTFTNYKGRRFSFTIPLE